MENKASQESVPQGELKKASLISEHESRSVKTTPPKHLKRISKSNANWNSSDAQLLSERSNVVSVPAILEESSFVNVHVLVVDDNLLDRKIVERLVKNASCRVTAVESGAKALELLACVNSNINLIISDYCMPEMSGYDLLRHVKEVPSLKGIPVVIMSSENVPSRIQSCLDHGAEEFILKPLKLADIKRFKSSVCQSLTNLLDHRSAMCKKRKFSQEAGFQSESPERGPRIGRVTVA